MRILVDTNVLISYLLQPGQRGAVRTIIYAGLEGRLTLLIPQALLQELRITVRGKPRLSRQIPLVELEKFASLLTQFGEYIAKIDELFPAITRDRNDDYLLAYAQVGAADYLVTGDKDLLALSGQVPGLDIVTPSQFVEILETNDLRP